jgi:hypothetical protein
MTSNFFLRSVVVAVAASSLAFSVAFAPSLLNDTDSVADIRLVEANGEHHFTLKPHTNAVAGRQGTSFSKLVIQFASGRSLTFDEAALQKKRRDAHVSGEHEFWVIHHDSVELLDARKHRRFEVR